jgi:hypothetical protein
MRIRAYLSLITRYGLKDRFFDQASGTPLDCFVILLYLLRRPRGEKFFAAAVREPASFVPRTWDKVQLAKGSGLGR